MNQALRLRKIRLGKSLQDGDPPFDFGSFLWGLFIGTVFIAPFIWTGVGREITKAAIARGAKVTREKVEEWIKKGEEEEKA